MLRYGYILFVFLLFAAPSHNQELSLPFAYVTGYVGNYDLWVMDATTGETLASFASELNECPIASSHNGQWLAFFQADPIVSLSGAMKSLLLDVESGASYVLDTTVAIMDFAWSDDDELFAYVDMRGKLVVYEPASQETVFVSETEHLASTITTMRFIGQELSYAVYNTSDGALTHYRWDGLSLHTQAFVDEQFENWNEIDLSPDGRFLRILSAGSDISVLDMETAEIFFLGSGFSQWLPDEAATLFYLWDNGEQITGEVYDVLLHSGVNEPVIMGSYDFAFSDDANYLSYFTLDEFGFDILRLFNRLDGEHSLLVQDAFMTEIQWLSDTELVYVTPPPVGGLREVYVYDVLSHTSRQLSNLPDLDKALTCLIGQG